MSNNKSKRRTVVLDGSNIVAQGPSDGNDGNILISAIECYEKLGYRVIPVMKTGTVWWMKNNEESGHTIIKKMKKSGQLKTFNEGDDEGVIQLAKANNAWIITYDTFWNDKEKNGKTTLSERKAHPDWDWNDIDSRTRGTEWNGGDRPRSGYHWSVVDSDFFDPTMPKAPRELFPSEYVDFRDDVQVVIGRINRMAGFLESRDSDELTEDMSNKVLEIHNQINQVMQLIPPPELPDIATVNKLLVNECKDLIRQINEFDEDANLTLSGKRDELRKRINDYCRNIKKSQVRAKADKEAKKAEEQAEKKAAKEAGMTLRSYRRRMNKIEENRKALEGKSTDEISTTVVSSFEEILGDNFNGSLKVSLDDAGQEINCESSLDRKGKSILIGKKGSTITKVAQIVSKKLGLPSVVRIHIV